MSGRTRGVERSVRLGVRDGMVGIAAGTREFDTTKGMDNGIGIRILEEFHISVFKQRSTNTRTPYPY
jgi:hypothetical protein